MGRVSWRISLSIRISHALLPTQVSHGSENMKSRTCVERAIMKLTCDLSAVKLSCMREFRELTRDLCVSPFLPRRLISESGLRNSRLLLHCHRTNSEPRLILTSHNDGIACSVCCKCCGSGSIVLTSFRFSATFCLGCSVCPFDLCDWPEEFASYWRGHLTCALLCP